MNHGFDQFETILDTISQEIVVFDAHGTFIYGNAAAHRSGSILSLQKEPSLKELYRNVEFRDASGDIIPHEEYPSVKAQKGIATRGNLFQFINKKTHQQTWYDTSALPIMAPDGTVSFIVIAYEDVTRKQLQEKRLKFLVDAFKILSGTLDFNILLNKIAKLMVPTIADWTAIDILDHHGVLKRLTVVHQDPEMMALVSRSDELFSSGSDIPNYRVVKTGRPEFVPDVTDKMIVDTAKTEEELQLLRRLGLCSVMFLPIFARGTVVGTITLAYAESGRRYADEDLEFVSDFCNHIGILLENARLYQAIERDNRTKERFLAVLSHELRNPLAPIKHSLELLKLRNGDPMLDSEIKVIDHQFNHLSKLLQDLLDMNRLTHGRYDLKKNPTELTALLRTVINTVEFMTKKKDIDLSFEAPPYETWITIDPVRIEQVLINILHNAEKFTPRGGKVHVALKQEDGAAVIAITDNGIGIDKNDLEKIFDLYFQGSKSDEYTNGLGMGLLLAREIVHLHGGTLEAKSEGLGTGSTFILRLPFNTPGTTPADQTSTEHAGASAAASSPHANAPIRRKLLIIDDNRSAADALAKLFCLVGYETKAAYTGKDGLDAFRSFSPDAAIIDLGMSEMDGYAVATSLRNDLGTSVPLIALSGYGMAEDIKRALASGFDRHLTKPAGLDDVRDILRSYGL